MNKTQIEWVKNPGGTQGYTWNPITGCLNGCEYCYARKLANGRLRSRYLANANVSLEGEYTEKYPDLLSRLKDPFYPRCRFDRREPALEGKKPKGIFVCDMSDLFGIGIPEVWTRHVLTLIRLSPQHRFYLLTKQPQNLIKWSPFPDNCWVGVSATTDQQFTLADHYLYDVKATIKFISFEPLLEHIRVDASALKGLGQKIGRVIIGSQTKPYKPPKIEWVQEIVVACDKAVIPVFLKDNLQPLWGGDLFYPEWAMNKNDFALRQEMPG